ncbi:MAG: hypothetical protein R2717_06060 [Schumannella sp.]
MPGEDALLDEAGNQVDEHADHARGEDEGVHAGDVAAGLGQRDLLAQAGGADDEPRR